MPKRRTPTGARPAALCPAATRITVGGDGAPVPVGAVHLADDTWTAACGGSRVSFRFPGTALTSYDETCAECGRVASSAPALAG